MEQRIKIIFLEFYNNKKFRETAFLCFSFTLNLIYAVSGILEGIVNHSFWLVATAFYYLVLGGIKYFVLRQKKKIYRKPLDYKSIIFQVKSYRMCGILMFFLNIAMTGMVVQMIRYNKHRFYPGYLIYLSAAVTFVSFISAALNVAKSRKQKDYLSEAVKKINLVSSFMSLFILQTALLSTFGSNPQFRDLINSIVGSTICFVCVVTALIIICKGTGELKKMNEGFDVYQEEK